MLIEKTHGSYSEARGFHRKIECNESNPSHGKSIWMVDRCKEAIGATICSRCESATKVQFVVASVGETLYKLWKAPKTWFLKFDILFYLGVERTAFWSGNQHLHIW